jgi:hypothetical protein
MNTNDRRALEWFYMEARIGHYNTFTWSGVRGVAGFTCIRHSFCASLESVCAAKPHGPRLRKSACIQ